MIVHMYMLTLIIRFQKNVVFFLQFKALVINYAKRKVTRSYLVDHVKKEDTN